MQAAAQGSGAPQDGAESRAPLRVLVVDDSRAQRLTLSALLRRAGYAVSEAADGLEALAACQADPPDIVLSDWVMPGMTGPEFCRAFRALERDSYGYFVLLTSKTERAEIAHGLEQGADDFLTKPVDPGELRARLGAGARIVEMQRELSNKNRLLGSALTEVQRLYDLIESDLLDARKVQQALVRDRHLDLGRAALSLLLRSSGHVGGDLVGQFRVGPDLLCLYGIDVSGHGISSALMTARLAGFFTATAPEYNVALERVEGGGFRVLPTDRIVARLNDMMIRAIGSQHYFTMAFAVVDLRSGRVRMTQAGHPHPVVQRADGTISLPGRGGLPVGLIEGAAWEEVGFRLAPGDRLLLVSDGITECPAPDGALLDDAGLAGLLGRNRGVSGPALLEALVWDLASFHGGEAFPDDVSAVLLEYRGA